MALIWSVYWPTPDMLGPDESKMNRVVEVDDEVARVRAGNPTQGVPGDGTARWPTEDELAEFESQRQVEAKAEEAESDGDLTKLTKTELLAHAGTLRVDGVDESMTKAKIAQAISDHQTAADTAGEGDAADQPAPAEA